MGKGAPVPFPSGRQDRYDLRRFDAWVIRTAQMRAPSLRTVWVGAFAGVALIVACLSGCASCGPESVPCPQNPCDPGEVCEDGECVRQSECPGGCAQGQICSDGECVWGEGQCEEAGASCDPNGPTNVGFVCVPWTGDPRDATCASVCGGDQSCASGSACVLLRSAQTRECGSDSDCSTDQICNDGICQFAACRPSECDGFLEGDDECRELYGDRDEQYPDGAKCYPVQNEANFCLPAGRKERGDSCTPIETAVQTDSYTETCGRGLACVDGTCVKACTEDGDCSDAESCLGVESETVRSGVGRCADGCEPFTEEACDAGETCKPVAAGGGRCIEAGDREAFAECAPGERQCEEGTVCVVYQEGSLQSPRETIARCHPLCDISAGERGEDGTLGSDAQEKRDATCPQPDPAPASLRVAHAAEGAGPLDVYRSGKNDPLTSGLAAGSVSSAASGDAYFRFEAGAYDISALEEGAPRTDLPLAETMLRLGPGESRVLAAAAPGPNTGGDLQWAALSAPESASFASGSTGLRVAHTIADAGRLDVVAVPAGGALDDSGNRIELAADLEFGRAGETVELETGSYNLYAFPAGADRSNPSNADVSHEDVDLQRRSTLFLHGTLAPADNYPTQPAHLIEAAAKPRPVADQPPTRCIEDDSGAFGYCQQTCPQGPSDYGRGICRGDQMGCQPVYRADRQRREHLCAPVGDGEVGDPCNPSADYGECREGNYCLEYGNTREGFSSGDPRGLCRSLCATGDPPSSALECAEGESCQRLSYQREIGVGQCGIPCSPDEDYSDAMSCPEGLRSCTPIASLQGNLSGQGDPPVVRDEQPYCSASGDLEPGTSCGAQNCRPRAECMYPRSRQSSLVDTLLSPYVGGSGQTPRCRLRCDPFDGDDSAATCDSGETCLFNYPWSAEVGHCAEIESDRDPGSSCENPGLSCGEDSICVDREGESVCMRFCDYEGPSPDGELRQGTCPSGFQCHPFTRDIGVCRR